MGLAHSAGSRGAPARGVHLVHRVRSRIMQSKVRSFLFPYIRAISETDVNYFFRYMRSTMSTIPHTGELLTSSGMPFSIMVQPLAIPSPEEDPIQVVDNGDVGPLRCVRCKASLFLVIFGYFWLFLAISVWAIKMTSCFFYRRT